MEDLHTPTFLKLARKESGLSREKVAELIGVSTTTVMRWEKGVSKPFLEEVSKLAQVYNRPIGYFVGESVNSEKVVEIQEVKASHVLSTLSKIPPDILDKLMAITEIENKVAWEHVEGAIDMVLETLGETGKESKKA